ncbi:MAG: hypothetical protein OIF38_16625, partial [Cellvibrionaceae bacterium]|nr:hypothetical protein [Cellvibrionaceae bacterium]
MHSADKSSIDALELRTFPLGQFDSLRPSAISKDSRGYLWLAGEDGLQRSDGYNWRRFSRDKIDKMVADQDAGLWLLTDQGLVYFDTISANAKLYQQEPGNLHGLPTKAINALLVDATGGLWLAHAQGLSYLAEGSDVFENYSLPSYGRDTIAGLSLCQHASGDIYVGTSAGVYVKRAASRNFKRLRYRTLQGAEQALAVNQLALVGDYIWAAGADFGLLRFRPSADLLISPELIQPADKLVGTQFSALLRPQPKRLWALSNNNGLFVFDAKTGAQLKHIEYQQLQDTALGSAQINAALYDNNGLVWLALENAAQLLGLIEINAGPSSPALVIAELKLGEKDQTLTLDTDFELALPNNSVSLALSALDFRTPEAIRFRYQLNRGPWVEMSAGERSIYLAAINPGRHQLTIQAADALGQWSADTLTRQFRVLPAWYQSLWFKIGA